MAIFLHQFDPSATNLSNHVVEEPHLISNATANIAVAGAGLFYTKSMLVRSITNNTVLQLNTDYQFQGFDAEITALTGYETAAAVSLINQELSGEISFTYQAVGGKEGETSSFATELRNKINQLLTAGSSWADILARLQDLPVPQHSHHVLTDLTGLNAVRTALNSIVQALTDARIPVLSKTALDGRIDRLLAIIATQRHDITLLSAKLAALQNQVNLL